MADFDHKQALPPGFRIGSYRVVRVLGAGGFGVTYLCEHTGLRVQVAVKEYLPNEIAVREGVSVHPKSAGDREGFEWGLSRFLDEARTLTRFEHRNLVRVRDCFEANNTAYIVMDYEKGESLDRLLQRLGTLTEAQLKRVLLPVADGLRQVHAAGFLHRDIKPSNIFVRRSDESPVLLDFGSARQALGRKSKSMTAIASAGYSPPEQYESDGEQGPWTDIYALSALCYRAITGKAPTEAPSRQGRLLRSQTDPLPSLAETVEGGYSTAFLEAVDWGLRVIETERPQSLDEWLAQLGDAEAAGRRTGGSKPSETADRPATQKSGGFVAKAAWLVSATAAIGVALYFALAYWPQGSGQDQGTASESSPLATQPRRSDGASDGRTQLGTPLSAGAELVPQRPDEDLVGCGSALLVVETKPSGVEVLMGDQSVGETPLELTNLRSGAYDLTLRHPHYETVRLRDQAFTDGEVLRVERTLTRGLGKLTVLITPRNAWVERDGERLASRTPVTLEGLPAGPLELTLGADEHRTAHVRAEVPKDGLGRLERTLERIVYGTLMLELVPADATVTLPDIALPYRPGMQLPGGRYRVIAGREGYAQATRAVTVPGNGEARERIDLLPLPQPFTVTATPSNASVKILGVVEAYQAGMALVPGDYQVRVSAPRYEAKEETVRHGMGPTRHAVELSKVRQPFTVEAVPAAAHVRLMDGDESYRVGMLLPWGEYRVEVKATGYKSKTETVQHGQSEPTVHRVELEKLEVGSRFRDCAACPELVVVPSGTFPMGAPESEKYSRDEERPVRTVVVQSFAAGVYEVTFAEWDACISAGGCGDHWPDDEGWGRGRRPVIDVSWNDAQLYVEWLSGRTGHRYRLLSESEWEYAARAGTTTPFHTGSTISTDQANYDGNDTYGGGVRGEYRKRTVPVGSFSANGFGLHDVHGNVMEWVQDCWNYNYWGAPSDGSPWESGDCGRAVLRGGSWISAPWSLRSAHRDRDFSRFRKRKSYSGFRVARMLTP